MNRSKCPGEGPHPFPLVLYPRMKTAGYRRHHQAEVTEMRERSYPTDSSFLMTPMYLLFSRFQGQFLKDHIRLQQATF